MLRDILQFDNTLNDTYNRITNGKRTCNLILGAGDGKVNFKIIEKKAFITILIILKTNLYSKTDSTAFNIQHQVPVSLLIFIFYSLKCFL